VKISKTIFQKYFLALLIFFGVVFFSATFLLSKFVNYQSLSNGQQQLFIFTFISIFVLAILFITTIYIFNKKLYQSIATSEKVIHRYDALSNATNDAIWDYDVQTHQVFYNDRLSSIFGYSADELKNNTEWWENNIHPEDKERVVRKMNNLLELNKITWEDEYRFKCKDDTYKIVFDRSYIVRDINGKALRLIGAMKDVTKMRTLESILINKQLEHKNILGKNIIKENEEERKHLKDALHEDVSQILVSAKYYISMLRSEQQQEKITTSLSYLDEVLKKINNISNQLFSSTFDLFGLKDALNDLLSVYQNDANISFDFEIENFDESKVDKPLSLLIFRTIEEKISRIIHYAKSKHIDIVLRNDKREINLAITFQSDEADIASKLHDANSNFLAKIEIYNGTFKLIPFENNNYTISVVFK
jgi:two-component system, NarL family, sensor histidine kinase UhpB